MGEDEQDGEPRWLPPSSEGSPGGSTPPPGGEPGEGEARWGAPAPPPAPPLPSSEPAFYPQQPSGTQPTESSGKATTALVMGILGLVLCPWVCAILALVFGYGARKEIDASGGRLGNRGLATAGIILGWIGIVYAVIATIYIITLIDTPDDDGNGVPDGIDNAAILPLLAVGVRVASVTLF